MKTKIIIAILLAITFGGAIKAQVTNTNAPAIFHAASQIIAVTNSVMLKTQLTDEVGFTNAPATNITSAVIIFNGSNPRVIIHYKQSDAGK